MAPFCTGVLTLGDLVPSALGVPLWPVMPNIFSGFGRASSCTLFPKPAEHIQSELDCHKRQRMEDHTLQSGTAGRTSGYERADRQWQSMAVGVVARYQEHCIQAHNNCMIAKASLGTALSCKQRLPSQV
jgi:hypothetical protein